MLRRDEEAKEKERDELRELTRLRLVEQTKIEMELVFEAVLYDTLEVYMCMHTHIHSHAHV